jgi:hypothetical protein
MVTNAGRTNARFLDDDIAITEVQGSSDTDVTDARSAGGLQRPGVSGERVAAESVRCQSHVGARELPSEKAGCPRAAGSAGTRSSTRASAPAHASSCPRASVYASARSGASARAGASAPAGASARASASADASTIPRVPATTHSSRRAARTAGSRGSVRSTPAAVARPRATVSCGIACRPTTAGSATGGVRVGAAPSGAAGVFGFTGILFDAARGQTDDSGANQRKKTEPRSVGHHLSSFPALSWQRRRVTDQ